MLSPVMRTSMIVQVMTLRSRTALRRFVSPHLDGVTGPGYYFGFVVQCFRQSKSCCFFRVLRPFICGRLTAAHAEKLKALIETFRRTPERVFLVGVELKDRSALDLQDSLNELGELASTAGGDIIGTGIQKLDKPIARTFIGSGKAAEFAASCKARK